MSAYFPTREAFAERVQQGNLIPVYRTLLADQLTPVSAYERVRRALRLKDKASHTFLLESVEGGERIGRYSFIGGTPRAILRSWGLRTEVVIPEGARCTDSWIQKLQAAHSGLSEGQPLMLEGLDPLAALKQVMSGFVPVTDDALPPFIGGAVGFMAYECIGLFEPVPVSEVDPIGNPDAVFMITDTLVVFDRVQHTIRVMANALVDTADEASAAYDRACARVDELCDALRTPGERHLADWSDLSEWPEPVSNIERPVFTDAVERIKEYIRAGDVIQTVMSQRFEVANTCDSLSVYRALRAVNPSPYMFLLDMAESAVVGASPEIHVRCTDRRVQVRPIAGTRPRSGDPEQDQRHERELLNDPKECAEHIMLVDLARNDIGRVCEYGSVNVPELMVIERYSHVMHIVSHVEGLLRPDLDMYDLMRATFPAGTVSGAPKIRAMQILSELEPERRGPYAGAVGYFGFDGQLDSAITIRTIVLDKGKAYVQAGAGIVADSVPDTEYEETRNKARALIKALALARRMESEEDVSCS